MQKPKTEFLTNNIVYKANGMFIMFIQTTFYYGLFFHLNTQQLKNTKVKIKK